MITLRNKVVEKHIKGVTKDLSLNKDVIKTLVGDVDISVSNTPKKITIKDMINSETNPKTGLDSEGRYTFIEDEYPEEVDGAKVIRDSFSTTTDEYISFYNDLLDRSKGDEDLDRFLTQGFASDENITGFSDYNKAMYSIVRKITALQPYVDFRKKLTYDDEKMEFDKCKYDICYWLDNYCIVQGAGAFVKIKMNKHLKTVAKLYEASVMTTFVTSRQSSKTTIALACTAWYFNFWANTTLQLINLSVSDNNKNMQMIKLILQAQPSYLRTWNPEAKGSKDVDNVASKESVLNSKLKGLVINPQDPDSTGRGTTSALYFDEVAYLKHIATAYASIAFAYNTYSKMARAQHVPAPILNTSTPNDLMNPSGKFFHDIWINAYEVSFDEVEDKLPSEIYDWFMSLGAQSAKVYQPWYAAFGRVSKPENIDPNNPNNLIHIYEDMTISYERMYELDPVAATWLLETKQAVHFNLAKIKKDIYCLFLSSNASAIFDEETADAILGAFARPVMTYAVPHVKERLELYEDISDKNKTFLISVDPAFSSKGDFLSITIINIVTKDLAGHLRTRTGKIEYISDIVVDIHNNLLPSSPIVVERNNFGKAVLENLEKVPSVLKKLFFYYEKKKDKKFDKSAKIYGINTTKENREKYFNTLMNLIYDRPEVVKSKKLGEELITLEMKNGKIQAMSGCHDDSVLSYGIGLYVIEYKAQFLFAFTKTKQEFEINLSKLVILNDKSLNSSEMAKGILEDKLQIMHDERTLTEEILGDFFGQADQMFKNHINIFNKFNS